MFGRECPGGPRSARSLLQPAVCRSGGDRVYIDEVPVENVGHTPLLDITGPESWAIQSEPARIFVEVCAPPGLPIEEKRRLIRALTEAAWRGHLAADHN
jgi:hypothetical protein